MKTVAEFLNLEVYYDFSSGVSSSDAEIMGFISTVLSGLRSKMNKTPNLDEYFSTASTGKIKVFGEAYKQHRNNNYTVYISVCEKYRSKCLTDVQF